VAAHSRRYDLPLVHLAAGCVSAGRGEAEEAERHARLAEQAADSLDYGQERLYAAMARALACQARGDYPGMAGALGPRRDAASTGSPVYLARLLLAHGRLLRRTGQRRPALERLRRAQDLYLALRAEPFVARAEQELAACALPGHRARAQHSVLALTSRETEVAQLAAQGRSNPEIAAELYISRKSVEYHLGNVYAKCGLTGRRELRRLLEQRGQPAAA
jgi:DNA-binding CsgD family transcriptional regulator